MKNVIRYIKDFRRLALLLFVIFTLSPCTVKIVSLNVVNIEYQRPLHKTKISLNNTQSCSSLIVTQTKQETNTSVKQLHPHNANTVVTNTLFLYKKTSKDLLHQTPLGVHQPLYILYKRFKIETV